MGKLNGEMLTPNSYLSVSQDELLMNARRRMAGSSLPGIVFRQATTEGFLRLLRGVNFRHRKNQDAVDAYTAMTIDEFEAINARQQWANWRTVPRNLNDRILNRPLFAIDLCCGVGHSTDVLACYLPKGSVILGIEFNAEFVKIARTRMFHHQDGTPVTARFRAQSAMDLYHEENGAPISEGSVDLVNCCGAVGVHFDSDAATRLAREVARVLRPDGMAMIDSGPSGTSPEELTRIFRELGFERIHSSRSCFVDSYTQICFRRTFA